MPKVTLFDDHLWRGVLYPAGVRDIPFELAIALNLHEPNQTQTPDETSHQQAPDQAQTEALLTLLNTAETPKQLTPLPKIGDGAGKRLIANRPATGYESLEQAIALNPELAKAPYRVDWAAIATWQPESGVPE